MSEGDCDRHWRGAGSRRRRWSSGWGDRASLPSSMPRVRKDVVNVDSAAGKGVSDGVCTAALVKRSARRGVLTPHAVDVVADN